MNTDKKCNWISEDNYLLRHISWNNIEHLCQNLQSLQVNQL